MHVKRMIVPDGIEMDAQGTVRVKAGAVPSVKVHHAPAQQKFTPTMIIRASMEGWMSLQGGRLTINGEEGVIVYRVIRTPGCYCCFDDAPMANGAAARAYIDAHYPGMPSPDPQNPHGYRVDNFYYCERED